MSDEHAKWAVDKVWVDRIVVALGVVCTGFVAVDLLAYWTHVPFEKHVHYGFETIPGFHAAFGFVSCVSLVLAARELRKIAMRPEDYYDE